MAQNLQLLKRRIKTSQNIAQISKAMEMISASKIKRAQTQASNNKPYTERISSMVDRVVRNADTEKFIHPYITSNDSPTTLVIAISPDRGLCGSLNTNLFKKTQELENEKVKIVTVGKKIGHYSARFNFELLASYPMGNTLPDYSLVFQLKKLIDEGLENKEFSKVNLLYADFVSLFTQTPTIKTLLPFSMEQLGELPDDDENSLFEPGQEQLLTELLPYYLEVQLYNALLQAYTSEQAARMMAMQNAKKNAFDIADYLTLVYNKSRQERITNEILDLANSKQLQA